MHARVLLVGLAPLLSLATMPGSAPAQAEGPAPPAAPAPPGAAAAETGHLRRLFRDDAPLVLTLSADLKTLFAERDTLHPHRIPATLVVQGDSGPVTLPVELATRGHFRLRRSTCGFPPLKVYFPKDAVHPTPFRGQGSLKLVTHCEKSGRDEQNLLVEYGIYRAYNLLTDLSHRARLAHVTYTDTRDPAKTLTRYGFFLEDDKDLAARNGGRLMEGTGWSYGEMHPAQMDLVAVFEYLIGNTDWSVVMIHNIRLLQKDGSRLLYPVAYDFDFSGLVNAVYAMPDGRLPIKSVRQRLYRGMCRPLDVITPTLEHVSAKKEAIEAAFAAVPGLEPKRLAEVKDYLKDGFARIAKPKDFMMEQDYMCAKLGQ
jgi:hypothetical protein